MIGENSALIDLGRRMLCYPSPARKNSRIGTKAPLEAWGGLKYQTTMMLSGSCLTAVSV
jgi:hypothetical protein